MAWLNRHRLDVWIKTNYSSVPSFDPTSLFTVGVTGGWWDAADHTTTFQDEAGTVPANTAGQAVKRINDKSGNGNDLILIGGNAGNPVLRNSGALWWLEFGGASADDLRAAYTFTQPITRISAARIVTWNVNTYLWDGGATNHAILDMTNASPQIQMFANTFGPSSTDMTVGANHVTTEIFDTLSSKLAVDNGAYTAPANVGPADPSGSTIGGGGVAGTYSVINWFGAIHISGVMADPDIASCRTFFGNLAGLSL